MRPVRIEPTARLGVAVCLGVALADVLAVETVLIPLLVFGPLVASGGTPRRGTAAVGALAIALAVPLGWASDIEGNRRHGVALLTTIVGSALAVWLAGVREEREQRLATSEPMVTRAGRLAASLHSGNIGEWEWDIGTGSVRWDRNNEILFGMAAGEFDGTFDGWLRRVDPRDRKRAEREVSEAVRLQKTYRFDHRCVWPDGSVHWREIIGEIISEQGEAVRAFGLVLDVDDRYRAVEERARLVEIERDARRRSEYLDRVSELLSGELDVDDLVDRVTRAFVPDIADWSIAAVTVDRPQHLPSVSIAHGQPNHQWRALIAADAPFETLSEWGLAARWTTGLTEVVELQHASPAERELLVRLGVESLVTVPLAGALGVLGALQLARDGRRPPFSSAEIPLLEELGARVGTALNTALLFDRNARSVAALETLQHVSGRFAAAATRAELAETVVTFGGNSLRASCAALVLDSGDGRLEVLHSADLDESITTDRFVRAAIESGELIVAEGPREMARWFGDALPDAGAAVAIPLRILHETIGALLFVFEDRRWFTREDRSMLFTIGSRCAGALQRAALYEREQSVALTFQRRLLPALAPTPDWLVAASRYEPASGGHVGGDWYQLLDVGDGRFVAVVGDAVGHNMAAAAAMGQLRASLATAVRTDPDPVAALTAVDRFAAEGFDTLGATAAYVLIDPGGEARYASAGHPPVILMRPGERPRLLENGRAPLLGLGKIEHTVAGTVPFEPGDSMLLYTDGLVERHSESLDDGLGRLLDALAALDGTAADHLCDELIRRLSADDKVVDDIALLLLRRV